jgi:hypothetical protein
MPNYINEPKLSQQTQGFCFFDIANPPHNIVEAWVLEEAESQYEKCRNKPTARHRRAVS